MAVPPSGICATCGSALRTRLRAEPDLRGVARELLAERDRDGVHQVRAAGLDDVLERVGLGRERGLELLERRQQPVRRDVERGEVHGAREDVVGGLAHVHVVVGVGALAREVADDLVGVHVRRGAGAGLEDVDRELVVVRALGDLVAGGGDAVREVGVEQAEIGVGARGGALDAAEPAHDRDRHALAGHGEVVDGLAGLPAPELLRRVLDGHGSPSQFGEAGTLAAAPGPGSGVTLRGSSGSPQWLHTIVGAAWWPHS